MWTSKNTKSLLLPTCVGKHSRVVVEVATGMFEGGIWGFNATRCDGMRNYENYTKFRAKIGYQWENNEKITKLL